MREAGIRRLAIGANRSDRTLNRAAVYARKHPLVPLDDRRCDRFHRTVRFQVLKTEFEDVEIVRWLLFAKRFEGGASNQLHGWIGALPKQVHHPG